MNKANTLANRLWGRGRRGSWKQLTPGWRKSYRRQARRKERYEKRLVIMQSFLA